MNGNKFTSAVGGMIGALLGAIIGAIPWTILIYFGWFIGYLAFLIAFASFFGYKLLRGSRNKIAALVAVFSSSVLLIFAMNFIMIAFSLYSEGYIVDIENIILYVKFAGTDFIVDMLISLAIGISGVWGIRNNIDAYIISPRDNSHLEYFR